MNESKLKAVFTDANDHNPIVDEDCPHCSGSGKYCKEEDGGYSLYLCPFCNGSGVTGGKIPYFSNEQPEMEAFVDGSGWITCPNCQTRFSTNDAHRWTGKRHMKCGQKIKLIK